MGPLPRPERKEGRRCSGEKADPPDPSVLAKHLSALENARERCQGRMADAVAKKLEQLSTSDGPKAGGSKHTSRPAAAASSTAASSSSGLEKPNATLEKEGKKRRAMPRSWKSPRVWKSPRAAPPRAVPPTVWKTLWWWLTGTTPWKRIML